jgi:hypothetical protein
MHSQMQQLADELLSGYILDRDRNSSSNLVLDVPELCKFGRYISGVKQTCQRFHRLFTSALLVDLHGEWLFVQYDTRVVVCKVKTLRLPKGFGQSIAEMARIRLQDRLAELITNWQHFQREVMVEGLVDEEGKMRNAMWKEIKLSPHMRIEGKGVAVKAKLTSIVAIVDRCRGRCNFGNEWMEEQVEAIGRHRDLKNSIRLWTIIARGVAQFETRKELLELKLDTNGLRQRLLQLSDLLDERMSCLLKDTSYTTLNEILVEYNDTISVVMTYLEYD